MYLNDLADGLSSNAKLFADHTSLFSVACNANNTANKLNSDLEKNNKWANQRKISFNPHPSRQAQEVIFSRKTKKNTIRLWLLSTIMYWKLILKSI